MGGIGEMNVVNQVSSHKVPSYSNGRDMEVTFVGSFEKLEQLPTTGLPEFAFIGRSNVGKSSIINALTGRKNLAHTSSTPGKTRLMNLFNCDGSYIICDLPGYGYAKISQTERERMFVMVRTYLLKRDPLFLVFLLLDSRLEPQKSDIEMMNWLGENGIPSALLYTKIDKLKPVTLEKNLTAYRTRMLEDWENLPPEFLTSAQTGQGREEVLQFIKQCTAKNKKG